MVSREQANNTPPAPDLTPSPSARADREAARSQKAAARSPSPSARAAARLSRTPSHIAASARDSRGHPSGRARPRTPSRISRGNHLSQHAKLLMPRDGRYEPQVERFVTHEAGEAVRSICSKIIKFSLIAKLKLG